SSTPLKVNDKVGCSNPLATPVRQEVAGSEQAPRTTRSRPIGSGFTRILYHSRTRPSDKFDALFGRQGALVHAERCLNQVRRPIQTIGGLYARLQLSCPLAVGSVA